MWAACENGLVVQPNVVTPPVESELVTRYCREGQLTVLPAWDADPDLRNVFVYGPELQRLDDQNGEWVSPELPPEFLPGGQQALRFDPGGSTVYSHLVPGTYRVVFLRRQEPTATLPVVANPGAAVAVNEPDRRPREAGAP